MTTTVEPMTLRKHPTFPWRLSLSWSSWEERTALEGGRRGREGVREGRREWEEGRGWAGREEERRREGRWREGRKGGEKKDGERIGHYQTAL